MKSMAGVKRKRSASAVPHPYLDGNFAPVQTTKLLTPCTYTGRIPSSLAGGQYVRNGANPYLNDEQDRACHWFDGDGMLTGVLFRRTGAGVQPEFVNNWIETDVLRYSREAISWDSGWRQLIRPTRLITPSISTLINPLLGFWVIVSEFVRTFLIIVVSNIVSTKNKIRKISVTNTAILYHDGRALATCESGPPMRIGLPGLVTIGWFDGNVAQGEVQLGTEEKEGRFPGALQMTTAHPKIDEKTGEMIIFHNTFTAPYVKYTIIPSGTTHEADSLLSGVPIPGITSAKLMHDFGVSEKYTVILDVPLSVNPINLVKGKPMVQYNSREPARFGIFPRHRPSEIKWFEDDACMITHTANTWDEDENGQVAAVCMLACRMTSPSIIWGAANLDAPSSLSRQDRWKRDAKGRMHGATEKSRLLDEEMPLSEPALAEIDSCQLHYFRFPISSVNSGAYPTQSFSLSAVDMEFPTVAPGMSLKNASYVYGCSSSTMSLNSAYKAAVKIDIITKMHVRTLVERGQAARLSNGEPADTRTIDEVLRTQGEGSSTVQLFPLPKGCYAGEPRFVPNGGPDEDDGHLLFFVFDEAQLLPNGEVPDDAVSELWVLDAKNMRDVVAKVRLTQRVPYGLHGDWFTEEQIVSQRPVQSKSL